MTTLSFDEWYKITSALSLPYEATPDQVLEKIEQIKEAKWFYSLNYPKNAPLSWDDDMVPFDPTAIQQMLDHEDDGKVMLKLLKQLAMGPARADQHSADWHRTLEEYGLARLVGNQFEITRGGRAALERYAAKSEPVKQITEDC